MNMEIMQAILAKIKEYDTICLFRHFRPDGDCKGATKGLQAVLKATWPEKQILLINDDHSDYLAFLGDEDDEVEDAVYQRALAIVLDTATMDRIANKKFTLCKELIKIDHHLEVAPYGDISWVEHHRSSACEMIAHFCYTFRDQLVMTPEAAKYLYTGMVTDSGRFQYDSVSGDTLRCAGYLLDQGIDTDRLFAQLYLHDFEELKFRAQVYKRMKITENGVAYVHLTKAVQEQFGLSAESASACVGVMDSIKGCLCWIAFIDNGDEKGTIRVRLRSRFASINTVAEHYRGGGHAKASGATVYNRKEMNALIREADAIIKEYKETHEGWL